MKTYLLTQNLYLEATEEVSLDSPERDPILSPEPTPAITPVTPTTLVAPRMESKSVTSPAIFDRSREEVSSKLQIMEMFCLVFEGYFFCYVGVLFLFFK